jgi:hypothetical protein
MIDSKIPQVPMVAKLRTGRSVIVDYMSDRQLTETYCIIQVAHFVLQSRMDRPSHYVLYKIY